MSEVEHHILPQFSLALTALGTTTLPEEKRRYEDIQTVGEFLATAGYDDCFGLFRQCLLTSKLQSYRFRHSAQWVFRLHHGPQQSWMDGDPVRALGVGKACERASGDKRRWIHLPPPHARRSE